MIISNCKKIVGGSGEGVALVTAQPLNFLAMVDSRTGMVIDSKHQLHKKSLKGVVLAFPYAIGSSVGAYTLFSLREFGCAPAAVICSRADITTASGCAIAGIPVVDLPNHIQLSSIKQGSVATVQADEGQIILGD
jgi:predicted aconitase with swiveling domain